MKKRLYILFCIALSSAIGFCSAIVNHTSKVKQIQTQRITNSNTICVDVSNGDIIDGSYLSVLNFRTWEGNKVYADIYEKEIFKTCDIATLSIDDIVVINGASIDVDSITYDSGNVIINKDSINEVSFISENNDEYIVAKKNDKSYLKLLSGNMILSGDVVLIKNGRVYEGLKNITGWIEDKGLVEGTVESTISVENGKIVRIEIENFSHGLIDKLGKNNILDELYDAPIKTNKVSELPATYR